MTRALIEQWLPAATVGAESLRDGSAAKKPPNNRLHVWWARRPLTASRAAVLASLLPAWPSDAEVTVDSAAAEVLAELKTRFPGGESQYKAWYVRTLGIFGDPVAGRAAIKAANLEGKKLEGNGYGYPRAFTVTPDEEDLRLAHELASLRSHNSGCPVVLDLFAGGGAIPFEAARYGCATIANELNPVATAVLQGTVSLPAALGPSFAKVIADWGAKWSDRVAERLTQFFPRKPDEKSVIAYIWAHAVPCPTTGRPTPLSPDFWIARDKGDRRVAIALEVDRESGTADLSVVEGPDAAEWGNRSTYKGGTAESIWTGETFSGDYIRKMAGEGRMSQMLLAVATTRSGMSGRCFRAPSDADLEAISAAEEELGRRLPAWEIDDLVPTEQIDSVSNYDRGHRMYGINRW